MLGNYLVSALRNFARHKLYSFINIAGLAIGLACATFILLFLRDELSYDAWIPGTQNLYRVESTFFMPGRDPDFFSVTPFPVVITMKQQIPEVVAYTHLIPNNVTAQIGDRQFPVQVMSVDTNFFRLIRLPFVEGNPATAIAKPTSIVLSQASARKFFGATEPLGKTVLLGTTNLTVTGVFRDLPHNTHLTLDLVIPNTSQADPLRPENRNQWLNVQGWGYVQLAPHADLGAVMAKLKPMLDGNIDPRKQIHANIRGSDLLHLHLTPFRTVHLARFGEKEDGRWGTVNGFAAIAVLILLIACINYMNLATARAAMRAREVSLRKVVGAKRSQLIVQFMAESVITALVALALALGIVKTLLPSFDSLLDRPIHFLILTDWPLSLSVLAVALAAGLLGGIYPAFVLSGFRPAARLGAAGASGSGLLRTTLVVLQFAISIGLGIAVLVIFAQISFSRAIDLGFDRHNLVVINGAGMLTPTTRDAMAQALSADPSIAGAAQSNLTPLDGNILVTSISMPGSRDILQLRNTDIDPDFINVYGMKLLAGRNLSRQRGEDLARAPGGEHLSAGYNILINEAAARQFGYTPASAVGKTILRQLENGQQRLTIVGVVGNANFDGLEKQLQPFIYFYDPKGLGAISVRVRPGQNQAALAAIDRIWHRFMPTVAIRRRFQEDSFDHLFIADEQEGKIFSIFVGIAIFIACLGLFGLASFTAERRTKEIGIRKIFGARTRDIVRLLLWQFSIPVLIANLIAWPVAWYFLHHWLQGYAYKVSLSPLYFLMAGVIALLIAWGTVIIHTLAVARASPIRALRYE
jgi:putative ABC transport system permease protein